MPNPNNKFLIWLNFQVFPFSYKYWKVKRDKVYYRLKEDLRVDWINAQNTIFSQMLIPIFLIFIVMFLDKVINLNLGSIILLVLSLYLIGIIFRTMKFYDKYTDEKFLELSKF